MRLGRLDPYRTAGAAISIIALMLPWYFRTDGYSISLWSVFQLYQPLTSLDVAIILLLMGILFTMLSENGTNVLILGYICTALLMEEYRLSHLMDSYGWGIGLYLGITALIICFSRPLVEYIHRLYARRRAPSTGQTAND